MNITKEEAREITKDIQEAVAAIFYARDMAVPKVKTTYGDVYKVSFESSPLALNDAGVNVASPEASAYERFHDSYGLPAGLLGKKFESRGETYTFAGLATRRPKYPIVALKSNGDITFFTENIKTQLMK